MGVIEEVTCSEWDEDLNSASSDMDACNALGEVTISLLLNKLINERGFDEALASLASPKTEPFSRHLKLLVLQFCSKAFFIRQEQILRKAIPFLPVPCCQFFSLTSIEVVRCVQTF